MMKICTSLAKRTLTGLVAAFAVTVGAQQPYPAKPIRIIVPFPPGGSIDPMARMVGQRLTESWGQQVLVENRPGGNAMIATEAVAKAPPDGYTLLLMGTPHVINPHLFQTPYDAIKDFAPVATVAKSRFVLVLHPSLPAATLQQFVALAKSRPGQLNFSSSGTGNTNHLAGELFNMLAGVRMQHVPYKGAGPAITDLIGGQVQLSFQVPISVIGHIKAGRVKPIAITGEARASALPEVPTFAEAGLPGYELAGWNGVFAPAGTPKEIVDRMSSEVAKMLAVPQIIEKLISQGLEPLVSTPEQFTAMMKADMAKFAKIIKVAGIKAE